jgi:aldehyde dehydrogenase (NAD+)
LLGLISVLGPALAMGNRAVVVASQPFPLVAGPVYQLLETSDIPAGVANILTGMHRELAPHMARHAGIDALWGFSHTNLSAEIETASADTLKRTWVNNGRTRDWFGPEGAGRAFLDAATEVKTVWVPYGE